MKTQKQSTDISEEMIFQCFAAAQPGGDLEASARSFVDVEEYENQVMYPEFARWARKAGKPKIAELFLKVAGEEKLHAVWLRELYSKIGTPEEGDDTIRAKDAIRVIKENSDRLIALNPEGVIEKALKVAIRVETREYRDIYPKFRDQAREEGKEEAAEVYQRVIDSEREHARWFEGALAEFQQNAA